MNFSVGHVVLPFLAVLAGSLLIYGGSGMNWGLTAIVAGVFFVTTGIAVILFTLARVLPGPFGAILRHPFVTVGIVLAVLGMLAATVIVGIFRQWH